MEATSSIGQVDITFDDLEFAVNPEPRCPVVLLLDTSGSMNGIPIQELNQGLKRFWEEVSADSLAAKRVEVAVVTFGPVTTALDFSLVVDSRPPTCTADGLTPIGEAIVKGCRMLQDRKRLYRQNGIRPWLCKDDKKFHLPPFSGMWRLVNMLMHIVMVEWLLSDVLW